MVENTGELRVSMLCTKDHMSFTVQMSIQAPQGSEKPEVLVKAFKCLDKGEEFSTVTEQFPDLVILKSIQSPLEHGGKTSDLAQGWNPQNGHFVTFKIS